MTSGAAMVEARKRVNLSHAKFDEDTQFVADVLKWLRSERLAGRLKDGPAIGLVLFDFRPPYAAAFGSEVDLRNGGAVQGAIHLCNSGMTVAKPKTGATGLVAIQAHVDALTSAQLLNRTSIIFEPTSRRVEIRLACLPKIQPLRMTMAEALAQSWSTTGMGALDVSIDAFHMLVDGEGEGLLHDGVRLRSDARRMYRNALFIFLIHEMGLQPETGFKVVAVSDYVKIRESQTARVANVTAIGGRSRDLDAARRWVKRIEVSAGASIHVSCLACARDEPPSKECAQPPVSLRHRHVEAA